MRTDFFDRNFVVRSLQCIAALACLLLVVSVGCGDDTDAEQIDDGENTRQTPQQDPCEDVECPTGRVCAPETGECVDCLTETPTVWVATSVRRPPASASIASETKTAPVKRTAPRSTTSASNPRTTTAMTTATTTAKRPKYATKSSAPALRSVSKTPANAFGCLDDTDCAPDKICEPVSNQCAEEAIPCADETDCPDDHHCAPFGYCSPEPECQTDEDCSGNQVCTSAGICHDCVQDDDCPEDWLCRQDNACIPAPECDTDDDCDGNLVCNVIDQCAECGWHKDCDGDLLCNARADNPGCVECIVHQHCHFPYEECDRHDHVCEPTDL